MITITVISFLFWNRITRERLPLDVQTLEPDLLYNIIIFSLLLFNFLLILRSIKAFFDIKERTTIISKILKSKFIRYFLTLLAFIVNSPKELSNYLAKNFQFGRRQLRLLTSYFAVYLNYPTILCALFIWLPRIIVAHMFLIDVFYYGKFYYFYKSLWLLLVPFILQMYLDLVLLQSQDGKEFAELHLIKIPSPDGGIFLKLNLNSNHEDSLTF